jgi:hypothetical protein
VSDQFDRLSKGLAEGMSRGRALKMFGAGLAGTMLAGLMGTAKAAPQTCVTCICGTGRPCNPKSTTCAEVRAFPAEQACSEACARQNQNLCGLGNTFHCPHGCPA